MCQWADEAGKVARSPGFQAKNYIFLLQAKRTKMSSHGQLAFFGLFEDDYSSSYVVDAWRE